MYAVKNGKPVDKFNHTLDDWRYFAMAKLGEGEGTYIGTTKHEVMPL
jgi:hypothetical protein